ncbi:1,4-dihydroxy-2-naphthoate octaprenyltransferase [Gleimia coleocanis DSM 15436]|uniref:1,4-dihydroxy-2-naphthoate octaprenyltransferase n=1 Tax=Gleimia coleocanis DSM 15436 TaxID=525245 RepID=C0W0R5_9ACTO|nr:1,4-dihydroxy-2-naphthoate polyprenyltransferase [Gleimia coleocanis]EEH63639.1 1,4-dihydroxy-2-naphthoate octaprenyltransferase [Gleimia coleocanis DSM 15436]
MSQKAKRQATFKDWLEGARLRTLPAAVAPVLIGAAAAYRLQGFNWALSVAALLVALALQIGVNFSNDYSDGIRGTDDKRSGPLRLTASGLVPAKTVLKAALVSFAFAGVVGLGILVVSGQWILLLPGVLAVVAAWFYTGGKNPYGYAGVGLSELLVFVFFGLMATIGTTWVQVQEAPLWLWAAASAVGMLSVALLFINNIRDIPTDTKAGKRTVAVRLGDGPSRMIYSALIWVAMVLGLVTIPNLWVRFGSLMLLLSTAFLLTSPVMQGASGKELIPVLKKLGLTTLLFGVVIATGFVIG